MKNKLDNTAYFATLTPCLSARFAPFTSVRYSTCCPNILTATFAKMESLFDLYLQAEGNQL
jgi:hypothetical protein